MEKIKTLTNSQIIISIDRLTRFKFVEDKYLRVFKEIILSNLIEPKYRKSDLDKMSVTEIRDIAVKVFNSSFDNENLDLTINLKILEYEKNLFNLSADEIILLENRLNYKDAISRLGFNDEKLPYNLKWLKALALNQDMINVRKSCSMKHPIEKIVLTEGITEEILLPKFAKLQGYDFNKEGVYIISAGGKNQVVKLFYRFCDALKIPIFVLLDKDAYENYNSILPKLRTFDKIHLLACGEFEDLLSKTLVHKTLNTVMKNFSDVSDEDLNKNLPMVKILEEIYRQKGIHEFKKAEFAKIVAENISKNDITPEIKQVITEIKNTNSNLLYSSNML